MKMTDADFQKLATRVVPLDTQERRQIYREGKYPRAEFTKDVNKRYRWDLLFASGGRFHHGNFMTNLYKYLNDAHIDTALTKLVPDL